MKVFLSNSDYLAYFGTFISRLDLSQPDRLDITTHDKWVSVHPAVLTFVAALGLTVDKRSITIDEVSARSGHYLERMGLFQMLGLPSQFDITKHEASGRFVPLTVIKTSDEQTKFITDMIPLLHLKPEHADAIKYVVGELVRNVLEHSRSEHGAIVAAQYYPTSNMIRLGICDTGIGVKQSITRSHFAKSDIDALKLALIPGITGTTRREGGTEANAGAGLFFIKSMASIGRDYFAIYSGKGVYRLLKRRRSKKLPPLYADPNLDKHSETNEAPNFSGTLVAVDISLETTEHFSALLSAIRSTYAQAVKERRKARYKRPKFL